MHTGDQAILDNDGYLRGALYMLLPLIFDAEHGIVQLWAESKYATNLVVFKLDNIPHSGYHHPRGRELVPCTNRERVDI